MDLNLNVKGIYFSFTAEITRIDNGDPTVFHYKIIWAEGNYVKVGLIGTWVSNDKTPEKMLQDLRQNHAKFDYIKHHRGGKDLLMVKTKHCRLEETLE